MSSCVIVAIPEKNDPVWRVSSEKIPHLTILFLGEVDRDSDLADRIADAVSHISNTLITRFGLYSNRRDTLGDDEADVLFFDKSSFYNPLIEAREYMLKDFDIYSAYLNADQYPEWTPHLTLGYPNAPAKNSEELGSYPWVRFDKIAVWFGDFDGFELLLKDEPSYGDTAAGWSEKPSLRDLSNADIKGVVKMADISTEEVLEHFGVKGMRWGVRNKQSSTPKISRKQNRQMNREARAKFDQEKMITLYAEAKKAGNKVLVETMLPGTPAGVKTVITGEQFVKHLEAGGALNVRTTEIFARQKTDGTPYERNTEKIGQYKKQNFRKTS